MTRMVAALLVAGLALAAAAPAPAAEPALDTEEQKTLYALGLALAGSLGSFNLTEAELRTVTAGLADGVLHRARRVDLQAYRQRLQALQQSRLAALAQAEKAAGQQYAAKAAAEPGATRTATGLVITTLRAGAGVTPKATDTVRVHYHGTMTDGTVFDSSVQRGQPATFALSGVIRCWTEGLQLMKVGGKARLVCPSDLAYGDRGSPPRIRPGSTLVFEVELLEIVEKTP